MANDTYTDEQLRNLSGSEITRLMQTDVEAWRRAIELRYASEIITPKLEAKAAPQATAPAPQFATHSWTEKYFVTKQYIKMMLGVISEANREFVKDETSGMATAAVVGELRAEVAELKREIQELKNWKTQQERLQPAATTKHPQSAYLPS